MSMANPYQTYQNNSVNTASPGELTLMLYNGILKFIKQAKQGIINKNIEAKNTNIQKAQKIISELMVTTNPDYEVSEGILAMYDYMNRRLMEANVKNDVEILDEVEGYAVEFRNTWKEVIRLNRQQQHGQGGRA
ncbi:flagellar export chaperone FliS [Bacillus marinisedimentorum]|uniref:flagellar export chaperone FliS n=1 Tax=Bacillus marinisedimentorum TaxID=1821260 RepID=UPI0007DFA79E|nr:flagellar export chaperone FliS [Bacillus marinisedimentorum]